MHKFSEIYYFIEAFNKQEIEKLNKNISLIYRNYKKKYNFNDIENLENFYDMCNKEYKLDIIGLMCLPPMDKDPGIYFSKMYELINKINLNELSMGMSNDYMEALKYKSTFLRIGSQIFGSRN